MPEGRIDFIEIVCTGRKNISQSLIDGSFFVPYSILDDKISPNTLYCLSVWNDVKDQLALCKTFLAESEYKGKANFWTTKTFPSFF